MGRVSKRYASLRKQEYMQSEPEREVRRYRAGIYARLSSDYSGGAFGQDIRYEARTSQEESLDVQIEIAKSFVEEFNLKETREVIDIKECYTDMGKTGSNFQREGFLRLMQDIRLGEINCVIVKDLSRFGRNYLEAGNYIEKIFPFLGVRFISVADNFDTGKNGNENIQIASEIKNLVNDMYAKDFSKKAKIHLKQMREEGSYAGGPPPYGYISGRSGKRRVLIPDENTEAVVRFIYEKFIETESYTAVADELNRRRINPPGVYRRTKETYYTYASDGYKGWDKSAVERIVKSETYAGNLVQGKTRITARDEKNRVYNPESEWVVSNNTHEPLVDKELYKKASELCGNIKKRSESHKHLAREFPIEENIFDSILYCGVCGRKMTRSSSVREYAGGQKARLYGYFCLNGGQTKINVCPDSNRISKNELVKILLPLINIILSVFINNKKGCIENGRKRITGSVKNAEAELRAAEVKIRRLREKESGIYIDYRSGKISQAEYIDFKMKHLDREEDLRKQQERQQSEIKELHKLSSEYSAKIRALLNPNNKKDISRDMAEAFISRIQVYPGKRMEVIFSFRADCLKGVK